MGDGIIKQVERYCDKLGFSNLTTNTFDEAISTMRQKAATPKGNKFVFVCNEEMDMKISRTLREYLKGYAQDGTYFFSKGANGSVKVGANFDTYHIQGNEVSFVVDRCLSHEYPDRSFGIFLDYSADMTTGKPGIAMFTLRGADMISGNLKG